MDDLLLALTIFSVTQLTWLILFLVIYHGSSVSARLFAALLFGIICYQLLPFTVYVWHWGSVNHIVVIASISNPGFLWLFCRSLFCDNQSLRWWHYALVVVYVSLAETGVIISNSTDPQNRIPLSAIESVAYFLVPQVIKLSMVGHVILLSVQGWRADLIESRRQFRGIFVAIGSVVACVAIVSELWLHQPLQSNLLSVSMIALLFMGFNLSNFTLKPGFLAQQVVGEKPSPDPTPIAVAAADQSDLDEVLAPLSELIEKQQIYKEHGLTVTQVAERVDVPAYRLRKVINQQLNYSNFNQFLNKHRIQDACEQLVAPETQHLPILSIALDVGFRSLSSFNKTFKEQMDKTPTEFRKEHKLPQTG
jgi:AraC-like DNA-binding protein